MEVGPSREQREAVPEGIISGQGKMRAVRSWDNQNW